MTTALLLIPGAGRAAPTISLNGVPIDGVVSQRFDNVSVVIDDQGNLNIVARGYAVARPDAAPAAGPAPSAPVTSAPPPRPPAAGALASAAPAAEPRLARRYFVVAEQSEPGITEYDVSVFVNGRWVREIRSDGDSEPFEVTRFLNPGPNKVTLVATKRITGNTRRSTSREATLRVLLGEGSAGGGTVYLEAPLVSMTRTAADTETFSEEHNLVAR